MMTFIGKQDKDLRLKNITIRHLLKHRAGWDRFTYVSDEIYHIIYSIFLVV